MQLLQGQIRGQDLKYAGSWLVTMALLCLLWAVADKSSVASLAEFIRTKLGRLDILVNNAGFAGATMDANTFRVEVTKKKAYNLFAPEAIGFKWDGIVTKTFELEKRMVEALIPLLQSSTSPRIVNVTSIMGNLQYLPNKLAKGILSDEQNLTVERVEEVLNEYLKDFKEGSRQANGWTPFVSANIVSSATMNAYTRILAKKYPNFCINVVCPGFVKMDINFNNGKLTVEEGAISAMKLVMLPNGGPSGLFFIRDELTSLRTTSTTPLSSF
ncbi:Short-chain dehydrogenase/reductase [Heracleum sosnowskyi]|uniref:Short-chain dehydrogenase/reductase n=1 Tax=Heracleum sosnowskyi TaxID=360622 RepID=A0AAD8J1N3_9APIA|nr:Short-chain dehydrogenase/reductase [Heracleum sosnowskyi]